MRVLLCLALAALPCGARADVAPTPRAFSALPAPWPAVPLPAARHSHSPIPGRPLAALDAAVERAAVEIDVYPTVVEVRAALVLRGRPQRGLVMGLPGTSPLLQAAALPLRGLEVRVNGDPAELRRSRGLICVGDAPERGACDEPQGPTEAGGPVVPRPAQLESRYGAAENDWWIWAVDVPAGGEAKVELRYQQDLLQYVEGGAARGVAGYNLTPGLLWRGPIGALEVRLRGHGVEPALEGLPPTSRTGAEARWELRGERPGQRSAILAHVKVDTAQLPGRRSTSAAYLGPDASAGARLLDYLARFYLDLYPPEVGDWERLASALHEVAVGRDRGAASVARAALRELRSSFSAPQGCPAEGPAAAATDWPCPGSEAAACHAWLRPEPDAALDAADGEDGVSGPGSRRLRAADDQVLPGHLAAWSLDEVPAWLARRPGGPRSALEQVCHEHLRRQRLRLALPPLALLASGGAVLLITRRRRGGRR